LGVKNQCRRYTRIMGRKEKAVPRKKKKIFTLIVPGVAAASLLNSSGSLSRPMSITKGRIYYPDMRPKVKRSFKRAKPERSKKKGIEIASVRLLHLEMSGARWTVTRR